MVATTVAIPFPNLLLSNENIEAEKMFWRVKGKGIHVWSLPQDFFISEETLDLPELPKDSDII